MKTSVMGYGLNENMVIFLWTKQLVCCNVRLLD